MRHHGWAIRGKDGTRLYNYTTYSTRTSTLTLPHRASATRHEIFAGSQDGTVPADMFSTRVYPEVKAACTTTVSSILRSSNPGPEYARASPCYVRVLYGLCSAKCRISPDSA